MSSESFLHVLVVTMSIAYFATISWATRYHFNSKKPSLGLTLIFGFSAFAFATYLFNLRQSPAYPTVNIAQILAAFALFIWAMQTTKNSNLQVAFDELKSETRLVVGGPYSWVRNPFYLSYLIFWFSGIWASTSWIGLACSTLSFVTLFTLYMRAIKQEEDYLLRSPMAGEYANYSARVPRFVPNLGGGIS